MMKQSFQKIAAVLLLCLLLAASFASCVKKENTAPDGSEIPEGMMIASAEGADALCSHKLEPQHLLRRFGGFSRCHVTIGRQRSALFSGGIYRRGRGRPERVLLGNGLLAANSALCAKQYGNALYRTGIGDFGFPSVADLESAHRERSARARISLSFGRIPPCNGNGAGL